MGIAAVGKTLLISLLKSVFVCKQGCEMSVNISVKILVLYGDVIDIYFLINRILVIVSTGVNNLLVIVDYSVKNLISIGVKRCSIISC